MKNRFSLNIGLPSIVLVFLTMCLFSLSVLSLVSASADWKLSQKNINKNTAYYNACNLAYEDLATLNQELLSIYTQSEDSSSFFSSIHKINHTYTYPISELQILQITLDFHLPDDQNLCYDILSWQVITNDQISYDDSLHVIP